MGYLMKNGVVVHAAPPAKTRLRAYGQQTLVQNYGNMNTGNPYQFAMPFNGIVHVCFQRGGNGFTLSISVDGTDVAHYPTHSSWSAGVLTAFAGAGQTVRVRTDGGPFYINRISAQALVLE